MILGAPQLLPLFWLIPVLVLLGIYAGWARRRRLRKWADAALWTRLAPRRSGVLRGLRTALILAAAALALGAAVRPQVGARLVQVERKGIDALVILDVSLSMDATDVAPSRLERSKQEVRELMDGLRGDRVGIVIFSGNAFLLCPLTLDVAAANIFLDAVTVDVLPDPGTNLAAALDAAGRAFETEEPSTGARMVVLFTDGEGHEGDVQEAAKRLADAGIPILSVGVGTPGGEPIPIRDEKGRLTGYKKDRSGNVVLSRLDEGTLREIADMTGGEYFPATIQGHEVDSMLDYVNKLERGELGGAVRRRVEERFQIPAAVAAIFLLLALMVPEARTHAPEAEGGTA